MIQRNIVLLGFGSVGRAFYRLLLEKKDMLEKRYGQELRLKAVLTSRGGMMRNEAFKDPRLAGLRKEELQGQALWRPGLSLEDVLESMDTGVVAECTISDLMTGEPALGLLRTAIERGWDVAASSKAPLAVDGRGLQDAARRRGVSFKFSSAAGAALPSVDVSLHSLAGSEVTAMEGILNGTTNYILTRMQNGLGFNEALAEAQQGGIAEPDPSLDVDGWDTAAKLVIIASIVSDADFKLKDVRVVGIAATTVQELDKARAEGKKIKLLARMVKEGGRPVLSVLPLAVEPSHPLYNVDGTEKGITFLTDTMGAVTLIGGRSDPRGAAAALLKDVVNAGKSRS